MQYTNIPTTTPKIGDIVLFGFSMNVNDGGVEYKVVGIRNHNGKTIVIVERQQERPNGGCFYPQKTYGLIKSKNGHYQSKSGRVSTLETYNWRWVA